MTRLQRLAPDTLRLERHLDAQPETVWKWLADPELRLQWFAGGTKAERPGPFELQFDHDRLSADPVPYPEQYAKYKGAVSHLQILRIEPPRMLEFNWGGGWTSHLDVLATKLAGGVVRDFWDLHLQSIAAVKAQLGN